MKLESIHLKNFCAFKDAQMTNIPPFCVLVGANGLVKSTLFSVFGFLKDAMQTDVNHALVKLGGARGFQEVRSRGTTGPIEIEIKFRRDTKAPLATYTLQIDERDDGRAYVALEQLKYRRGSTGKPWIFLKFENGKGYAVTNELTQDVASESDLTRDDQTLKSPDLLAIKALAQFQKFPVIVSLGELINRWYVSDFHIDQARSDREADIIEHLSREGENLASVLQYLQKQHPHVLKEIIERLRHCIPGITKVEAKTTEEGRVLLKFQDGSFQDPFLARYVSDGTIKMLAYLILLNDPKPFPMLCVEEPENQLYPSLLETLAEEFRAYANKGGFVVISTHSPDFLNAVETEELFYLVKENGYTTIKRAKDNPQIVAYMATGDKLGRLWKEHLFEGLDPQ